VLLRPGGILDPLEFGKQALLHAEDRVRIDVGVVGIEDVSRKRVEAVRFDDEVEVRRPIGLTAERREELADRAVVGDRIKLGLDRTEPVAAVRAGAEDSTQVEVGLDTPLLHVVEAFVVGLPHVEHSARNRPAFSVEDPARDRHVLALAIEADIRPHRQFGRAGHMKRAQHCAFRSSGGSAIVDRVDQHRHAQNVGEQDELLPPIVAHVSRPGQELDRFKPFVLRRLDFLDGLVQLARNDGHRVFEAFVLGFSVAAGDDFDRVLHGEEPFLVRLHGASLSF
jgi:hypothetical protein